MTLSRCVFWFILAVLWCPLTGGGEQANQYRAVSEGDMLRFSVCRVWVTSIQDFPLEQRLSMFRDSRLCISSASFCEHFEFQCLDSHFTRKHLVIRSSMDTTPMCLPSVYLTLSHVTKSPRPSLSSFRKWSKTGGKTPGKGLPLHVFNYFN